MKSDVLIGRAPKDLAHGNDPMTTIFKAGDKINFTAGKVTGQRTATKVGKAK